MDLKSLITVKEKADAGVLVPWSDEEDTPEFMIAYTGRNLIKKARKNAVVKKLNKKNHKFEESIDEDILDKELMKNAVVGWKGLKAKHLKEILDPSTISLEVAENQFDKEIEFNEENKELLLTHYNLTFSRFISSVSSEVEVYSQYQKEQDLGNSESLQAT